jgi:hypothetical protein
MEASELEDHFRGGQEFLSMVKILLGHEAVGSVDLDAPRQPQEIREVRVLLGGPGALQKGLGHRTAEVDGHPLPSLSNGFREAHGQPQSGVARTVLLGSRHEESDLKR